MGHRVLTFAGFFLLAAAARAAPPPLVEARWLEPRLADARIVVVDLSDAAQHRRFHLPGAVHLPYEALTRARPVEPPPECAAPAAPVAPAPAPAPAPANGKRATAAKAPPPIPAVPPPAACVPPEPIPVRLDDAELAALLGRLGITRDKYVVAYDDLGGLNAARLYWELERIGHPRASVLDGGLVNWILEGRRVTNNAVAPAPARYELAGSGRANEALLADVLAGRTAKGTVLLDVRSTEEYRGGARVARSGHIPGARWWPWEQAIDPGRGFVRRDEPALTAALAKAGAVPKKAIVAYCRSGDRAAHTYLTLRSLGYENVRVYAASMNEYALDPKAPLKQGPKP